MVEWWQNVYGEKFWQTASSNRHASRDDAETGSLRNLLKFRIHVRLKPEGAPKRYASERDRMLWETDPDWCRKMASAFPYMQVW